MRNLKMEHLVKVICYVLPQLVVLAGLVLFNLQVPSGASQFEGISRLVIIFSLLGMGLGLLASKGVARLIGDKGFGLDIEAVKIQVLVLVASLLAKDIPGQIWVHYARILFFTSLVLLGMFIGMSRKSERVEQSIANGTVTGTLAVALPLAAFVLPSSVLGVAMFALAACAATVPNVFVRIGGWDTNVFESDLQAFENAEEDIKEHQVIENTNLIVMEAFYLGVVGYAFSIQDLIELKVPASLRNGHIDLSTWVLPNQKEKYGFLEELVRCLASWLLVDRVMDLHHGGDYQGVVAFLGAEVSDGSLRATDYEQLDAYKELLTAAQQRVTSKGTGVSVPPEAVQPAPLTNASEEDTGNSSGSGVSTSLHPPANPPSNPSNRRRIR